jgi:hypothetical protein
MAEVLARFSPDEFIVAEPGGHIKGAHPECHKSDGPRLHELTGRARRRWKGMGR